MPTPLSVCRSLGGVASSAQLDAAGVPRRALTAALAAGEVVRVRRGVVAAAGGSPPALHALAHGGRLTCHSLLASRGVWLLPDDRAHLHLGPDIRVHPGDGCVPVVHRAAARGWGDALAVAPLPALAELARCADVEHLVVALDSARRTGLVLDRDLPLLRHMLPPDLRRVVDFSTPLADSGLETLIRWRLARLGIQTVPQYTLGDGKRRDLLVGDRLIIEADGGSHDDPGQHREDMRRDAYATAQGYIVLRFGYRQIVHDWPATEAAILAALRRGLHLRPLQA